MVNFVSPVETIRDERAKHAMLLVETIKECANMTILTESGRGKLRGLRGGLHTLTFTQTQPRSGPADRFSAARVDPVRGLGATGLCDERNTALGFASPLSTVAAP